MQKIFEEYGQTIIAVIVAVALLGCVLGGTFFFKTMRNEMDVKNKVSYSKTDEALESFSERTKPAIAAVDTDVLHLHVNEVFSPLASVSCADAAGNALVPSVTSIVFIDITDGSRTEYVDEYDSANDKFDISGVIGKTGTLAVTYEAVDSYKLISKKTISFVVDAAQS